MPAMTTIDVPAVRARFPGLARMDASGHPLVHADAPGGTQVVEDAIDAMRRYLETSFANAGQDFVTSSETDRMVAATRRGVADLVGGHPSGVVFGVNMTTLVWHLSRALDSRLGRGDEIVCTRLDHDANVTPWQRLAERVGATVRWVGIDAEGRLDLGDLEAAVTSRTRLVAFPLASNVLGTVVDPAPLVEAARSVGALTFADAVHAAPHVALAQERAGIDVVACSLYKVYGPHLGALVARPSLLAELTPDRLVAQTDHGPGRWQTGTQSFEAIAGAGAALDYVDRIGLEAIARHEAALARRFLAGLADLGHVTLHGPPEATARTPTFSLTVAGRSPAAVSATLAERGILTFHGHCYALEPLRALGLLDGGGITRVGFAHYHDGDDVDRVLAALDDAR